MSLLQGMEKIPTGIRWGASRSVGLYRSPSEGYVCSLPPKPQDVTATLNFPLANFVAHRNTKHLRWRLSIQIPKYSMLTGRYPPHRELARILRTHLRNLRMRGKSIMAGKPIHIDRKQYETFRTMLLKLRDETRDHIKEFRRDQQDEASTVPGDEMDEARSSADVETHAGLIGRAEEKLRALDDALALLDEGKYGICLKCGDPIPVQRLKVLPFALHCVDCQGKQPAAEKTAGEGGTIQPYDQLWTPPEEMSEPADRNALRTSPDEDRSVRSLPSSSPKKKRPAVRSKASGKRAR